MSLKINNDTANGSATLQPSNTPTGDVVHTLPSFTTELAPRMQLMTAQATTGGTYKDFVGIPSWAKKITVMFNGVSTNGTSGLAIQLGTSGGIENTGYIGSTGTGNPQTVAGLWSTDRISLQVNAVAAQTNRGNAMIINIDGNTWVETGILGGSSSDRTGHISAYDKTLLGTLDRIRVTTVNGTDVFDAGTINILVEG